MAFINKLGNVFKKTTNFTPSIYQSIRCMSSSKLFVGGISYATDDHGLREAFAKYGEVVEARIIMDRESGRSRGFGFVTFASSEEASAAMSDMDGKDLHGRVVRVNYANDRSSTGFRGGYGGGGYGGGGYGGGGYGGGGYGGGGGGNYGDSYNTGGGDGYRGGSGDGNYNVADRGSGGFGGNYASSDSGVPSYNSGSVGDNSYGGSTAGATYPKEDSFLDDDKGDDYEPDDYANKRS